MPILEFPSGYIDDKAMAELPAVVFAQIQGERDPDQLAWLVVRDLALRDYLYTLSIMCAPDDPDGPINVNHALVADELYRSAGLISEIGLESQMSGEVGLFIADRKDPKEIIGPLIERDWLGRAASGYVLRWIVSRWQQPATRNTASLRQAAATVEEWCANHRIHGGKVQHVTRNLWPKYRSVSHLWAAHQLMQATAEDPCTPAGFETFCGTAQWLLEQGAAVVPVGGRAGETVLSIADAWVIPESYLTRGENGALSPPIVWNTDPAVHDIRNTAPPPFLRQPV